jgi:hypothetical protein
VDMATLEDILIMGPKYGDQRAEWGKTRDECRREAVYAAIEQQIGVEVTPAEVKQVTEKGLRILKCKMVYKRKYHIGEDGKERFLKWKSGRRGWLE